MISISNSLIGLIAFGALMSIFVLTIWMHLWLARRQGRYSPFTEDMFRLPAHSLRNEKSDLADDMTNYYLVFVAASCGLIFSVLFFDERPRLGAAIAATGGLVYALIKISRLFKRVRKVGLGCEGEEYTGQELNLLMTKGAFVFHDIPYKYGNIDHIVVGFDRILVVETKAVRKPQSPDSAQSREAVVKYDGETLVFPHFMTSKPIEQAKRHAAYLSDVIQKKCGVSFPVKPVVAIPGWFVERSKEAGTDVLVVNPKRAKALFKWLGERQDKSTRNRVTNYIASVARSVSPNSKRTDPDASRDYDIWLNPRHKEKVLGDY